MSSGVASQNLRKKIRGVLTRDANSHFVHTGKISFNWKGISKVVQISRLMGEAKMHKWSSISSSKIF